MKENIIKVGKNIETKLGRFYLGEEVIEKKTNKKRKIIAFNLDELDFKFLLNSFIIDGTDPNLKEVLEYCKCCIQEDLDEISNCNLWVKACDIKKPKTNIWEFRGVLYELIEDDTIEPNCDACALSNMSEPCFEYTGGFDCDITSSTSKCCHFRKHIQ